MAGVFTGSHRHDSWRIRGARSNIRLAFPLSDVEGCGGGRHREAAFIAQAAKTIVTELGLTAENLKSEVRDVLLVLFQQWKWDLRSARLQQPVVAHLRQDIQLALHFIQEGTGVQTPLDDPAWTSDSFFEHLWARMDEALPYELARAKAKFSFLASMYLEKFATAFSIDDIESDVEHLSRTWWPESYPLRRFALLFQRLHNTLGGNSKERITFDEENTIDYLILCTLVAEKLMVWLWLRDQIQPVDVPDFKKLLRISLDRITASRQLQSVDSEFLSAYPNTALYQLTTTRKLELFTSLPHVADGRRQLVLRSALNFAIMRNYAAHHDCLDQELTYSAVGTDVLTAITELVLLLLQSAVPHS